MISCGSIHHPSDGEHQTKSLCQKPARWFRYGLLAQRGHGSNQPTYPSPKLVELAHERQRRTDSKLHRWMSGKLAGLTGQTAPPRRRVSFLQHRDIGRGVVESIAVLAQTESRLCSTQPNLTWTLGNYGFRALHKQARSLMKLIHR